MKTTETVNESLLTKYEQLKEYLKSLESVAVAFSSGVDSTFLLFAFAKTGRFVSSYSSVSVSPKYFWSSNQSPVKAVPYEASVMPPRGGIIVIDVNP